MSCRKYKAWAMVIYPYEDKVSLFQLLLSEGMYMGSWLFLALT